MLTPNMYLAGGWCAGANSCRLSRAGYAHLFLTRHSEMLPVWLENSQIFPEWEYLHHRNCQILFFKAISQHTCGCNDWFRPEVMPQGWEQGHFLVFLILLLCHQIHSLPFPALFYSLESRLQTTSPSPRLPPSAFQLGLVWGGIGRRLAGRKRKTSWYFFPAPSQSQCLGQQWLRPSMATAFIRSPTQFQLLPRPRSTVSSPFVSWGLGAVKPFCLCWLP